MDLELEDKVCVITGASKGIGLAVTRALVAEGAVVVAGARTVENSMASSASRLLLSILDHETVPASW